MKLCKDFTWCDTTSRRNPCPKKAKFGDYCGTHSPEEKARRKKARPPTQFQRRMRELNEIDREKRATNKALKELLGLVEELRFLSIDQQEIGFARVSDYLGRVDTAVDSTRELLGMEKRAPDDR